MNTKQLYTEWRSLKDESISLQRAGADGYMTENAQKRDSFVYNRVKEIELILFPLLRDREILIFDNTPFDEAKKMEDKFYDGNYLIDWIIIKDDTKVNGNERTISGEVIYAKIPK